MKYKIVGYNKCYGDYWQSYFSTEEDQRHAMQLLHFFGISQGNDEYEEIYFDGFYGENIESEGIPNYD